MQNSRSGYQNPNYGDPNQFSIDIDLNQHLSTVESFEVSYTDIKLKVEKVCIVDQLYLSKLYSFDFSSNTSPIYEELQLIDKLKSHARPENCFLNSVSYFIQPNLIKIRAEISQSSLQDLIQESILIDEPRKIIWIDSLLLSFACLVDWGIYHSDINPTNILVTPELNLKLNYFLPEEIERKLKSPFIEGQRITGSKVYLPPELLELSYIGVDYCQFSAEKAEVFSLGLCIYELFTYESSVGLNIPMYQEALNEILAGISNVKVRKLLTFMLKHDPYERPTFRECLAIFEVNTLQHIDDQPENILSGSTEP